MYNLQTQFSQILKLQDIHGHPKQFLWESDHVLRAKIKNDTKRITDVEFTKFLKLFKLS